MREYAFSYLCIWENTSKISSCQDIKLLITNNGNYEGRTLPPHKKNRTAENKAMTKVSVINDTGFVIKSGFFDLSGIVFFISQHIFFILFFIFMT
jgi:hypothetical protein